MKSRSTSRIGIRVLIGAALVVGLVQLGSAWQTHQRRRDASQQLKDIAEQIRQYEKERTPFPLADPPGAMTLPSATSPAR